MSTPVPPSRRRSSPESEGSSGRIKLITIGAIVAVGLAGGVALAANSGILDASTQDGVGDLSAAGDLTTPSTQVIDVYLDDTSTSAAAPLTTLPQPAAAATTAVAATGQDFAVDTAGTVTVSNIDGALRLDRVLPSTGWTWQLAQAGPADLTVTLTDGARTLHFVAGLAPDGSITAHVDEPIAAPVATPAAGSSSNHGDDDGDDDGEYEGGEDDD